MKKYNEEHEWIEVNDGIASVGISNYAVEQLGDITFVELPEMDNVVQTGDSVAFIESVKAASDIYTPISGTVKEINESLEENPEVLNNEAETTWIYKMSIDNDDELSELMDEEAYKAYLETL